MDNEKRLENLEKRMEALELQIQELPKEKSLPDKNEQAFQIAAEQINKMFK